MIKQMRAIVTAVILVLPVVSLAQGAMDHDPEGYRHEFVQLVKLAGTMAPQAHTQKVSQIDR